MSKYFKKALLVTFAIKLLFYVFGNLLRPEPILDGHIFKVFMENDTYWYKIIFDQGYPISVPGIWEQSSFVFFPLYPLLLKIFGVVFGSFANSAFVLSLVLTYLWVKGAFKYIISIGKKETDAFWLIVLLQCIPFHYFYHMFYTELLFSTLLFWILYYSQKQKAIGVFLLSIMLTACRPTGLLFAFTIFLTVLISIKPKQWFRAHGFKKLLPFMGAPLGIGMYAMYCYFRVGHAFVFRENMLAWQRGYTWPWESFISDNTELQYLAVYAGILVIIGIYTALIRKGEHAIIILPNLIMPLCTGTIISYPRYTSVNHPIFEKLQDKFKWLKNPWVLGFLLLLNLVTFSYWVLVHDVLSY